MSKTITLGDKTFIILFPDLLRPLTPDERAGLKASIEKDGIKVPVTIHQGAGDPDWYPDGPPCSCRVLDGMNRLEIAAEMGLGAAAVPYRLANDDRYTEDATVAELRELALALNQHRRHLTPQEMQELRARRIVRVAEARQEGKSIRVIAEQEKVSVAQVQRDLADATVSGDTLAPTDPAEGPRAEEAAMTVGRNGKKYRRTKPGASTAKDEPAKVKPGARSKGPGNGSAFGLPDEWLKGKPRWEQKNILKRWKRLAPEAVTIATTDKCQFTLRELEEVSGWKTPERKKLCKAGVKAVRAKLNDENWLYKLPENGLPYPGRSLDGKPWDPDADVSAEARQKAADRLRATLAHFDAERQRLDAARLQAAEILQRLEERLKPAS